MGEEEREDHEQENLNVEQRLDPSRAAQKPWLQVVGIPFTGVMEGRLEGGEGRLVTHMTRWQH